MGDDGDLERRLELELRDRRRGCFAIIVAIVLLDALAILGIVALVDWLTR